MTTAEQVRSEESAATKKHRDLTRARRIAARQRETAWTRAFRERVRETKKRYARCMCDFRDVTTKDDLMAMTGCCHPRYICPRLDTLRRTS